MLNDEHRLRAKLGHDEYAETALAGFAEIPLERGATPSEIPTHIHLCLALCARAP
jgi:hypothetical protein